jgi:hypothetical protein
MASNGAELTSQRFKNKAAQLAAAGRALAAAGTFTQTYSTADRTLATPTSGDLVHSAVGGTANGTLVDCTASYSEAAVEENFKELATAFNLLRADVLDLAQFVNGLVDDLQAETIVS